LALLALATQFLASFGHVHSHVHAGVPHTDPLAHSRASLEDRTFFASLSKTCLPGLPEHSECTICTAMNLLGSSAMPQTVPSPGPHLRFAGTLARNDAHAPPDVATASFEARAPPDDHLA
jgi:hypothetical protein